MSPHDKRETIDSTDILPVLREMDLGTPMIVCKAPPGAGKTFLSAFCIAHALDHREGVIVVTNSYEQAYGVCARLHSLFPTITPVVYTGTARARDDRDRAIREGFSFATKVSHLMAAMHKNQPIVTVLRKLTSKQLIEDNSPGPELHFRWMILDEAWQMADADFAIIASLADGYVMVGDSGQIPPIVKSDVTRWKSDKSGPQRPAPEAALARPRLRDYVVERPMSVSRRLPQRSAVVVQKIFYPTLFFTGAMAPRRLISQAPVPLSPALALACGETPPGFIPVRVSGISRRSANDLEALATMVTLARELINTDISIDNKRRLEPHDIVLLVSRNSERRYLDLALRDLPGIRVATANKFQGAERVVSIVLHPLSGKTETTAFDSDAGRLCVMLSRHTHACFVVHRDGIAKMLETTIPNSPRALGDTIDTAHMGWMANLQFARWMEQSGSVVEHAA